MVFELAGSVGVEGVKRWGVVVELRRRGSEGGRFDSEAWEGVDEEGKNGGEKVRASITPRLLYFFFFFCLDTQPRFMYSKHMPARCIRAGWGVEWGGRKRIIRVL